MPPHRWLVWQRIQPAGEKLEQTMSSARVRGDDADEEDRRRQDRGGREGQVERCMRFSGAEPGSSFSLPL